MGTVRASVGRAGVWKRCVVCLTFYSFLFESYKCLKASEGKHYRQGVIVEWSMRYLCEGAGMSVALWTVGSGGRGVGSALLVPHRRDIVDAQ